MTEIQTPSIAELTQKAEAGDAQAQFELAYKLSKSKDFDNDIKQALSWLKRAAEQQLVMAQFAFGLLQLIEAKNKNISEEVNDWINDTFLLVLDNLDCDINKLCSTDYYNNLQKKLAGWLLSKNDSQTINLIHNLTMNILKGHTVDELKSAIIFDDNKFEDHFFWLKKSEENGCIQAKYWLAICYRFGIGVEINDQIFVSLVQESAQQGIARAQYKLAECYFMGFGVEASQDIGFEWCQKAAQHGIPNAQFRLSECYFNGQGVAANTELGFFWLENAAEQGVEEAKPRLANCYEMGVGVEKNGQQAFDWYMQAAESDHPESQYWLARYYFNGGILNQLDNTERHIIEADPRFRPIYLEKGFERAFMWAKKSASNGYGEANLLLGFMSEYGLGIIRDRSKAFEYFNLASANDKEGIAAYFLTDYYTLGTFTQKNTELQRLYTAKARAEKVSEYYDLESLLKNTHEKTHVKLLKLKTDIFISSGKFDAARELAEKNPDIINAKYIDEAEQKELLHKQLQEKEREMLSFFTHTMRNALATAPEALRQAIQLLGSDVYEKDANHYKAINKIASLFSSLSLTDCLIDTFKQSISDPQEFKQAWDKDNCGDASPKWVIASALRQSLNRILFMSDATDFKKLLGQPDGTLIKSTRKSFIDDVLPMNVDSQHVESFIQWIGQHLPSIEVAITDVDDLHFGANQTRFSMLFAITSELILNALRYWDGLDAIRVSWGVGESDCYVFCVTNHCQPGASSRLAGTHKGLAFIRRLIELLGEQAQFSCSVNEQEFVAELTLTKALFVGGS